MVSENETHLLILPVYFPIGRASDKFIQKAVQRIAQRCGIGMHSPAILLLKTYRETDIQIAKPAFEIQR